MLNLKSFLAVDFGAGSVKLAEFEVNDAGGLLLKQYGIEPLGAEGAAESSRPAVILKALQKLIAEKGIKARQVNVCAAGFQVFSKFVKLPPVEAGKVGEIIKYEAQQNVPFPLEEVVWDYQIMGALPSGELEVLLVAIKAEVVDGLFNVVEAAKMKLQLADVSPAALCNAFRYNYGDLEDCTMLLDIGAKTSNLLFFEKGKVFSRSINIGANSITQDFCNESKLAFADAERIKIAEGFVSLGGAYEEPENPHQAIISKIARQFMTRLHIQVNQTLQFYRGQQGGATPQRLFLSGGASIMPYTAQFFAEKLNIPVEYFNPLRNVQIDPGLNLEELARSAHSLGEVVGLGLRNLAHCPVELNLMPESTLRRQSFNQKKPYLIAAVFSLALVVFLIGLLLGKLASLYENEIADVQTKIQPIEIRVGNFQRAFNEMKKSGETVTQLVNWMEERYYWADILTELRRVLMEVEKTAKQKLATDVGVWLEKIEGVQPVAAAPGAEGFPGMLPPPGAEGQPQLPPDPNAAPVASVAPAADPNATFTLTFRAVSLTSLPSVAASANTDIAFAVLNGLKSSPLFDAEFTGNINPDEPPGTYTFGIVLKLKRPLKL
jgi:type IV pilus assembly protein PilM